MRKKSDTLRMRKLADGDGLLVTCKMSMFCCDCGLDHFFTIDKRLKDGSVVANDTPLLIRPYRQEWLTRLNRKEMGIKIPRKKRKT